MVAFGAYVSRLHGKLNVFPKNGGRDVVLVLAVVEEYLAHDVRSFYEAVSLFKRA